MMYLVSDYYATGEGRTVSILITQAPVRTEDYEVQPSFGENGYIPGVLKPGMTEQVRALREFAETFDAWETYGAQPLDKETFVAKYGQYLPNMIHKIIDDENLGGIFRYHSQLYLNFS